MSNPPIDHSMEDNFNFSAEDPDLEFMKQRVREMEAEAEKLRMLTNTTSTAPVVNHASTAAPVGAAMPGAAHPPPSLIPGAVTGGHAQATVTLENKEELDSRSIYVGNVDYGTTPEELQAHFSTCGQINRITILCDSYTGHPKGFAYIEFTDPESINNAIALNESLFRGRQLKVTSKRTNVPGLKAKRYRTTKPMAVMGAFNPYARRRPMPHVFRNRRASFM